MLFFKIKSEIFFNLTHEQSEAISCKKNIFMYYYVL